MGKVPRHEFVPADVRSFAYADHPLPIGHGQTISQPFIVAFMTEKLDPKTTDHVLEIGTGSGYQAAVLSELVARHLAHDREHAAIGDIAAGRGELFLDHAFAGRDVVVGDNGVRRETASGLGSPQGELEHKPDARCVTHIADHRTPVLPAPAPTSAVTSNYRYMRCAQFDLWQGGTGEILRRRIQSRVGPVFSTEEVSFKLCSQRDEAQTQRAESPKDNSRGQSESASVALG